MKECDGKSVALQVDFSENANLLMQNEIQSTHWNHWQTTIFTASAWIDIATSQSIVIVSDDLSHTKRAVYTFISNLISHMKTAYPFVAVISVFSDRGASQFKQCYLFSHFYNWKQQHHIKLIWNFFAASHGTGDVDDIGGTVKCNVWRHLRADGGASLNTQKYADIGKERIQNVLVIYISYAEIQSKAAEVQYWDQTLPVPNTLQIHCVKVYNWY